MNAADSLMDASRLTQMIVMGVLLVVVLVVCSRALYKGGVKGWWWPAVGVIATPICFAVYKTYF